ncbi:major facilitator superfamily domain-containing protein [Nemania abortiva]|nr:major facilitator superfamily domain-containing protein [Nemania abortiva]
MSTLATMKPELECFLEPMHIDVTKAHVLAHELYQTFQHLAAESLAQFLPTPISESILRQTGGSERGRGGTNLRVGFIELLGSESAPATNGATTNGHHSDHRTQSNIRRILEKSWPIEETLKRENPDSLFAWIGSCIAEVVGEGVETFGLDPKSELPMGVTFSFPIEQNTLSDATIMAMGKGFAITSGLDLGTLLVDGYEKSRSSGLPPIKVTAILNDAVATLVSFIYQFQEDQNHKAAMGLICGTGTNATIPLRQSILSPEKLPGKITVRVEDRAEDVKVAVNTEWSINGSAQPLRKLGLITKWDIQLDAEGEIPGFQPFEYMTSGRYLGELGRLMFLDYMKSHLGLSEENIPAHHYQPPHPPTLLRMLEVEFPPTTSQQPVEWTEESAMALYHIAKAIETRAAALVAAAIIALLACADDIPLSKSPADKANRQLTSGNTDKMNLAIGYTGGCIVHFQNYLSDCQSFLDSIIEAEFGDSAPVTLTLSPCHDGGITGAGVLCGASQTGSRHVGTNVMAQNHGDEPDEHTVLLQPGRQPRYETAATNGDRLDDVEEASTERDALLGNPDYESAGGPTALAPDVLKPASPEPLLLTSSEEDPEAGSTSSLSGDSPDDEPPRTWLVNTHPARFHVMFGGIMLTYFMALFDGTIMASSHPVITSYFGASNMASWLTTAFLLTSTAFQPLVGRLSDTVGRKPLYVASMAVFGGATAWCALAQSIGSFIAARAVCGLGAGGMMTCGAIAISDCVPIQQRGNYQSVINVTYGIAAASGAAFGGLLADSLGWRWEFGVQLVPLALCLTVAVLSMPSDLGLQEGRERQTLMQALRGFDFKGSILLSTSITFLLLGLNLGGNVFPWSHPLIIASLAVFAVLFPACLYVESRVERPVMPLALLHSTPRANMVFSNCIASFLMNAILFNAPLFFRAVLLKSATESGLYLVVPTVTASVTGTLTGILISRLGRLKWPLVCGVSFYLLGTILLSSMRRGWPTWAYLFCLVPAAAGQGFQFPGTLIAVLAVSDQRDQAVVTSTLQLWRQLGNVLGVACSSLVFQNALLRYLITYVSIPAGHGGGGEDGEEWKRRFIEHVRSSIEAVAKLPEGQSKDQVITSYEAACRATFLVCLGIAAVSFLLIMPVKLPRLGRK